MNGAEKEHHDELEREIRKLKMQHPQEVLTRPGST